MRQLYLDLDGVLADFDTAYRALFGKLPARKVGDPDPPGMWEMIEKHGSFYRTMPAMPDAEELWGFCAKHNPVILSGVPDLVPLAASHKREWLDSNFGASVPLITCRSRDKSKAGRPGDVIVDDWVKYKHIWEKMGGVWVHHTSAAQSIEELKVLGF